MKNLFQKMLVVALLMVSANFAFAAPPLSMIQKAKATVEETRYQLPVSVGNGLMLTKMSYDSKTYSLIYRYHYTIPVAKPSNEAIKESKLSVVHLLKANPNSEDMQFLKAGFTFYYNYYSENGTFLYAIKITPSDVK